MRTSLLAVLFVGVVSLSASAVAETLVCPSPAEINCVPAVTTIGPWQHNGGQMTGNTFMPNNQCANVIRLGPDSQRVLCCYTKCGVFIRDVRAKICRKMGEARFECE